MTDVFDRASDLEIRQREDAIANVREKVSHGESAMECGDCGQSIPEVRRIAVLGCTRCIQCQSQYEKKWVSR